MWLDFINKKTSVNLSLSASKHICSLLTSRTGAPPSILTALPQPLTETVSPPSAPAREHKPNTWSLQKTLADHRLSQSALQFLYGDQGELPACSMMQLNATSSKRSQPETDTSDTMIKGVGAQEARQNKQSQFRVGRRLCS